MKKLGLLFSAIVIVSNCILAQSNSQIIKSGVVHDTIKCALNSKQSYALYLPSYYTNDKQWPIIYIFEPAARGSLPVTIFKSAAERWGYIIVGSNNSRNGSWDAVFNAANAMIYDTKNKLNINTNRIYTSGFSGGARAAIAVATLTGQVRGIIGCGAGSPNLREHHLKKGSEISYVSVIGDADMNYMEVKLQEEEFTDKEINNIRLTWPSGHQWPPASMIDKAIQWLEYNTNDSISGDTKETIRNNFIAYRDSLFVAKQSKFESVRISEHLNNDFGSTPSNDILEYTLSKEYKKSIKSINKIEKRELLIQEQYLKKLKNIPYTRLLETDSLKPIQWWKFEIDKWERKATSEDDNVRKMSLRLLNLIWASCAEKSFRYERGKDYELALRLNEIWVHSQSSNVWALWSRAKLFALSGDIDGALTNLELAYENGMTKHSSVAGLEVFNILQHEPRYIELVSKLSK